MPPNLKNPTNLTMKFKINKDHFTNGLQQVLNVVATRSTMPILSNVLIEAADGVVFRTAPECSEAVRAMREQRPVRLSRAALQNRDPSGIRHGSS